MELYLIRHAQSRNNALPEEQRVEDPPITEVGHKQAAQLGDWIPSLGLTRLVTSPFLRTLQTTEHIHRATGLTPHVERELHELGGCVAGASVDELVGRPGMTHTEIEARFPAFQVSPEINGQGWWGSQPYESIAQAKQRAEALLNRTRAQYAHTEERVAYVMHADIKMLFLGRFHFESLDCPWNTSVTKIRIVEKDTWLDDFNRVEHLHPELLTK